MSQDLDDLSRRYVELGFGIERHVEGTVDAYFGLPELREAALAGKAPSPADLLDRATALLADVAAADLPPSRTDYLTAQLTGLQATCRKLTGETIAYRDEVRACFDIEPERIPDAVYDEAIAAIGDALPGEGEIADRMIAWRAQFEVSVSTARELIDTIMGEVRARAARFVPLPEGEAVEVSMVTGKPWSGYNWYLGGARSLIEINTDLPVRANGLLDLICHEGYPGHHTEHAIKEMRLYREQGFGEHSIQLINTPECVISEGIATLAESVIFAPGEAAAWRQEHLYRPLGITVDADREAQLAEAQRVLKSVAGNAALMLHEDGASEDEVVAYLRRYGLESAERARHRFGFISDPLWRPYVFTYHVGYDLLGAWLERPAGEDEPAVGDAMARRQARFGELLACQVTPSAILSGLEPEEAAA
jgi:hypothetical protein